METPTSSSVRFGVFELDARAGELRRSGHRVALQPQPLEILRALIERPGEVVTREELRRRVWSNGAYVDFDRSLNKAIVKLRDALGDDADSPRYIETLPRHGYRFIPLPQAPTHVANPPLTQRALGAVMPQPQGPASLERSAISEAQSAGMHHRGRRVALGLALLALLAWLIGSWLRMERDPSQSALPAKLAGTRAVAFSPPPHSIAVLPFVNISGDQEQQYFSDGLTEELLNSIAHIDGLQVAARTSSFSFREHPDIADVARKLNVATVLEGSVRRSGQTMRITAQLNDAVSGFHLWSQTYDRDISDVLKLQTEIATAVAGALKVRLLGDEAARIELGGTSNQAAFDAYLRGLKAYWSSNSSSVGLQQAIAGFTDAIRLDPAYALAYANRSIALQYAAGYYLRPSVSPTYDAEADARKSAELAPELALGHLALAFAAQLDLARAERELERALELDPGSERIVRNYGDYAAFLGHTDRAIAAARRAVALDPLNVQTHAMLAEVLWTAGRNDEAIAVTDRALALAPDDAGARVLRGLIFYALGNFERARASCEIRTDYVIAHLCLAIIYDKLGRHSDARAQVVTIRSSAKEAGAYLYAEIYAQWGKPAEALDWLDAAVRLRSPWLAGLKKDPLLDPLRQEPRFQAVMRELRFPD